MMKYLSPLTKQEIKTLGLLLGLSNATVTNSSNDPADQYLDDVITAWFNEKDGVAEKGKSAALFSFVLYYSENAGIPSWNLLESTLKNDLLRHNGIARKIRMEKLQT